MPKPNEIRLGQLLIQKRWCTLQQINRGLDIQQQMRDKGTRSSLGKILIQKGYVDEEKIKVALSVMGTLRLVCGPCSMDIPVTNYSPGSDYKCPKCQQPLAMSDPCLEPQDVGSSATFAVPADTPPSATSGPVELPRQEMTGDDPIAGKIIGGCQVLERIAKGGMGVVYKAKQLKLDRPVAVKILSEDLAKDRSYVHRFIQEARSAAELSHGNIVQIFDVGEINGLFYIILEYVDGSNLRDILDSHKRLDPARALEIALQAGHALKHAHQRGVIHRDIKPENIMVTHDGMVKIADLGLAKKMASGNQDGGITSAGAILGTPYYMAPEQVKDFRQVDGRSDIYSLGVTLFRALTGSVPFKGRTPVEVMIKVVEGKRPSIRSLEANVPEDVELFVDRMMHRRPDNRFQDFSELIRDLETILYRLRTEGELPSKSKVPVTLDGAVEGELQPEREEDLQEQES